MNTNKITDMERKLELRDIIGYLPYGLNAEISENAIDMDNSDYNLLNNTGRIIEISGIEGKSADILIKDAEGNCLYYAIEDIIPILRPLSDLNRTITHNGKEIIPIVECARIAFTKHHKFKFMAATKKEPARCALMVGDMQCYGFWYCKESNMFVCFGCRSNWHNRESAIPNQYQLFDYLHELKIDYRNLIDSGLAIDANTLETNPYK
jgi:hypothetical protein